MAYTITKSDGTTLATIADGTINTTATNLNLAGPNYVGYGQALNENLVYLLENFASNSAPLGTNIEGQLWFDKSNQSLKVFTTAGYSPVSGITVGSSFPVTQKNGDIFFNTSTNQLYISSAGTFDLIGPSYTKLQGPSGAIPTVVNDGSISGVTHNVVQLQFGNTVIATFSTDNPFLPSPAIPGFTYINPGITLNSSLTGTSFNSNVIGNLTGSVTGNVVGNLTGNVTGNVVGNVVGNLTGNVTGTTISGTLSGNFVSTNGVVTNLTSSNVNLTGGNVTGLTNVTTTNATATNFTATNSQLTNLTVANLVVAGGSISGLTALTATNLTSTNFVAPNAQITGGSVTGLTTASAQTATFTNLSSSNVVITGGSLTNLNTVNTQYAQSTNFSTGNAVITGGYVQGLSNVSAVTAQLTNLSTSNIVATGGNISNTVGVNNTLTGANLINATATTKAYSDNSTAVATTAYVNSVLPRGAIIMWGGIVASIPAGWQLCDGSNSTPNLQDRFVMGAGLSYAPGATGGTNSVTLTTGNLPSHTHLATLSGTTDSAGAHNHAVIDPGHTHTYNTPYNTNNQAYSGGGQGMFGEGGGTYTTNSAVTGVSLTQAPSHNHTLTLTGNVNATGSGQSFSIMPTYYALCYIQKMY